MYRTVTQLDQVLATLAAAFPQHATVVTLPEPSVEGRPVRALRLRVGGGAERRAVLFVGGTHARELMNPDAIVELAVDLLVSQANGTDVAYGGRTWPAADVALVLAALDLWLLPCLNPDGRHHVMTADDMWRKNRRDNPGTACDGVDLNRNFDLVWGVTEGQTSCSPCADIYCGPSAFSEPETRNVKHLLDTLRVDVFADVHSFSELVLHPWGHAPTQTDDPAAPRFTQLATGTCRPLPPPPHREFMPPADWRRFQAVAGRVVDDVAAVRGRVYTAQTGVALYPTTGTQSDYAYSRHLADAALHKTYGFTFETGPFVGNAPDSFHPADPEPVKADAKAAMLGLAQQSVCAIELIGVQLLQRDDEVSALREVRDQRLAGTHAGRQWVALFERVQAPLVTVVLADESLAAEAAHLLEVVGRLVADDASTLRPPDVRRAAAFLDRLAERAGADVRADVDAARQVLDRVVGLTVGEALDRLGREAPGVESQPVAGG